MRYTEVEPGRLSGLTGSPIIGVGAYGLKRWVYIFAAALVFNTTGAGYLCAASAMKAPDCCAQGSQHNHESEATALHHGTPDCCTASAPTSHNANARWNKSNTNAARRLGKKSTTQIEVELFRPVRLRAEAATYSQKVHSTKPPCTLSPLLTGCVLRI